LRGDDDEEGAVQKEDEDERSVEVGESG